MTINRGRAYSTSSCKFQVYAIPLFYAIITLLQISELSWTLMAINQHKMQITDFCLQEILMNWKRISHLIPTIYTETSRTLPMQCKNWTINQSSSSFLQVIADLFVVLQSAYLLLFSANLLEYAFYYVIVFSMYSEFPLVIVFCMCYLFWTMLYCK